ncbi:hypothetical protein ACH4U5_10330 [Streptomyces sp. NPDC020858]|uniref:hypothetical protein n=1 Tax=Streptomyces sp. NPDC020858 TaxID=3365097 RepID=UPI0037BB3C7C
MDVAFEEGLLPAGRENLVDGPARIREPQREQEALHQGAGQVDPHIPEVDLRLIARAVGLRDERGRRPAALLDPDLTTPVEDVVTDHRVRHFLSAVLVEQPVEDPRERVPLLARSVKISPQHPVDGQLVRIKT